MYNYANKLYDKNPEKIHITFFNKNYVYELRVDKMFNNFRWER